MQENPNFIKNNWFKIIIAVAILIVALSVGYYFFIYLPKYQKEQLDQSAKLEQQKTIPTSDSKSIIRQPVSQQTPPQVDPQIKIEQCEAKADTDADAMAKYEAGLEKSQLLQKSMQGIDYNSPTIQTYLNSVQSVIQSQYDHTYSVRYNYYDQSLRAACLSQ